MTKDKLREYIECGDEIEFYFNGNRHSITYWEYEKDMFGFSFCEFYQEPIHVKTFDELINITYKGVTVMEMLESLPDEDDSKTLIIF